MGFKSARFGWVVVVFGFQIGSGDDFFFIGVGLCLFVFVVVFVVCGLCKRLKEPEKKKMVGKPRIMKSGLGNFG